MSMLREKQAKLAEVEAKIAELQKTYDDSLQEKQKLERNIATTASRLKRAAKLTTALGDEQIRWSETVEVRERNLELFYGSLEKNGVHASNLPFSLGRKTPFNH